ncbi:SDR family NAD(P)-dependent oxidoreductase [Nocardia otitidiscaviarum]|nr:SDR family NAD(P)-dependent oxidoreductase [Nocardia otitidiscaviarum]MBF6489194.1 SDR family NAD(P)-dependent oxidoreductase [Nocardia otitidiscaviarum]
MTPRPCGQSDVGGTDAGARTTQHRRQFRSVHAFHGDRISASRGWYRRSQGAAVLVRPGAAHPGWDHDHCDNRPGDRGEQGIGSGGGAPLRDHGVAGVPRCPVRVTGAFLPLLRLAENPRIVMVSSGMGSVAVLTDPRWDGVLPPALGYPATKSALNTLTVQYARGLDGIRVNAVDPGYTATDLNGHSGMQTVTEGTDAIVRLAQIGPDGPTGGFFDRQGAVRW